MHDRRYDIVFTDPLAKELRGPFEVGGYVLPFLPFEELRAGGDERIHKPGTVLAGAASRRCNPAVNLLAVPSIRLDDVEVVFAFFRINVGIAGVLFFCALMVCFQRPGGSALVLCKTKNTVLRDCLYLLSAVTYLFLSCDYL